MAQASAQSELAAIVASVRAHVAFRQQLGFCGLRPTPPPVAPGGRVEPVARVPDTTGNLFLSAGIRHAPTLEALQAEMGDCRRCKLWPHRTNLVFGVGNPGAELVFVGEAPGRDEDTEGEPFVGRAGRLLTEMITRGMGRQRSEVYIANVIKCRPPNNRNPEPDEVASCEPFLARQLEIIRPRVIVVLGSVAAQVLLRTRLPITRLRGRWHEFRGMRVMPTFHPAYLLRNPNDKRLVWEDIKEVMRELGWKPAGRRA